MNPSVNPAPTQGLDFAEAVVAYWTQISNPTRWKIQILDKEQTGTTRRRLMASFTPTPTIEGHGTQRTQAMTSSHSLDSLKQVPGYKVILVDSLLKRWKEKLVRSKHPVTLNWLQIRTRLFEHFEIKDQDRFEMPGFQSALSSIRQQALNHMKAEDGSESKAQGLTFLGQYGWADRIRTIWEEGHVFDFENGFLLAFHEQHTKVVVVVMVEREDKLSLLVPFDPFDLNHAFVQMHAQTLIDKFQPARFIVERLEQGVV